MSSSVTRDNCWNSEPCNPTVEHSVAEIPWSGNASGQRVDLSTQVNKYLEKEVEDQLNLREYVKIFETEQGFFLVGAEHDDNFSTLAGNACTTPISHVIG